MDLLVIVALFLLFWAGLVHFRRKCSNFPSGPYGVPLLGYLPFVRKNAHKVIANLAKKHGSVFSLSLGTTPIVFANDFESINEVLVKKGDVFSGRALTFVVDTIFCRKEVLSTNGPVWKDMRRFILRQMRNLGLGKTSLEPVVVEQVEKVAEIFDRHGKDGVINFDDIFVVPITNVIWSIIAGTTYEVGDKKIVQLTDDVGTLMKNLAATRLLNYFPFLRHIMPKISGYETMYKSEQSLRGFMYSTISSHAMGSQDGQKDLIDGYMEEIERRLGEDGKEMPPFTTESMMLNMKTLFMGGVETTATTLRWGFLIMAIKQDIQRKVHDELDSQIGLHAISSWNQRILLPYTQATLLEIERYFTLVPLSLPHAATANTTLLGYDIPKGTVVITNLWAMHFDPKSWDEPEEFRPERFLDADGKVKESDCFMPFSAGPRICLAASMAKLELFLFFAYLMQKFRFELDPNGPAPSLEPLEGILLSPKSYSLKVTRRNK